MEFINFILENNLVVVVVLYIIGMMLKGTEKVLNKYIPLILLPIGIALTMGVMRTISVDGIIQGILVTGTAVYADQIVKQLGKNEEQR